MPRSKFVGDESEAQAIINYLESDGGQSQQKNKDYDPNQPRADDGKFGPNSGVPSKPGVQNRTPENGKASPSSLAAKAKKLPAAIYKRAANKVQATYSKLEGRYGKKTAIAIMGAGILGLPLPIPGSSILTAAPILVAAEMYLKFSGSKEAATLSQAEIEKLGKQFIKDLLAGWNVGPQSALPKLSLNGSHK
jgi:hypothetical protein